MARPGSRQRAGLTHVDADGRPAMVDVGAKAVTSRSAVAECEVHFPAAAARALRASGYRTPKGPVLDTAVVAGTMAAKRTAEWIPFCHPLPIERCRIEGRFVGSRLRLRAEVAATAKTGVEMEALVAVTCAALTVYDMCKALSPEIEIRAVGVVRKRGGRRDVERPLR